MTQLMINLPDEAYQALQAEAQYRNESVDKIIARCLFFSNMTTSSVKDNWSAGFFEKTAGCLADDPLERAPQGEYEERLELL